MSRVSKCPVENAKTTTIAPKNATFGIIRTFNIEASNISNYYYFPHVTKQDYDRAFKNTYKEAFEHPDLSPTLAARINGRFLTEISAPDNTQEEKRNWPLCE
jgi:hypothetical protein